MRTNWQWLLKQVGAGQPAPYWNLTTENKMENITDKPSFLIDITLVPWTKRLSCPKCGISEGELVNPDGVNRGMYAVNQQYCPGGQPPEVSHLVQTATGPQEVTHPVTCAAIKGEHHHINCTNCGYHWFGAVKPQAKGVAA